MELAEKGNGFVTTRQALEAGIKRSRLSEAVAAGELVRVARGVYCLPETWEDEFLIAHERFSRGVFSDGTALYLHGFTDRTPERLTMTFPRSYNATGARKSSIEVRTCSPEVFGLGLVIVHTPAGNEVPCYDLERTLCDLVRGRSVADTQLLNPAMRRWANTRGANVNKLMDYARKLGVLPKIRNYLEVLL